MSPSWGFAAKAFRGTQTFSWTMRLCIAASVVLIAIGLWRWGAVEVRGHFDEVQRMGTIERVGRAAHGGSGRSRKGNLTATRSASPAGPAAKVATHFG